jgi:carboxyl-terminal processing protease
VSSCVEIADEFLDKGTIVYVEDKDGNREDYYAEDGKTDMEVVVVVNENSASASEILAAALKDNGFKIVGETTFGKGVIQGTSKFRDGSALKLTIMQYFSPNGNAIHEKGVKPTYEVKDKESTEKDEQLEKAEELLK